MTSGAPHRSVLGPVLLSIFIHDTDSGIKFTLSKSVDNSKLSGALDMPEGHEQAKEVGPGEPPEVQRGQVQHPAPGLG